MTSISRKLINGVTNLIVVPTKLVFEVAKQSAKSFFEGAPGLPFLKRVGLLAGGIGIAAALFMINPVVAMEVAQIALPFFALQTGIDIFKPFVQKMAMERLDAIREKPSRLITPKTIAVGALAGAGIAGVAAATVTYFPVALNVIFTLFRPYLEGAVKPISQAIGKFFKDKTIGAYNERAIEKGLLPAEPASRAEIIQSFSKMDKGERIRTLDDMREAFYHDFSIVAGLPVPSQHATLTNAPAPANAPPPAPEAPRPTMH